jgi:large subunit ribosomal protein L13
MKKTTKIVNNTQRVIDASGRTLGRVATEIAMALMGKDRVTFSRNSYSGAPVKVINSSKIRITEKKLATINHKRYSGQPGGLRIIPAAETKEKKGMKELVRLVTKQMLPDNKIRRDMLKNLIIEE